MAATTRQHPAGHRPQPVRDQEGGIACLACDFTFAWGDTARPIGYGSLPRGLIHQIQAHDPFAHLDDDEFANARFGA